MVLTEPVGPVAVGR